MLGPPGVHQLLAYRRGPIYGPGGLRQERSAIVQVEHRVLVEVHHAVVPISFFAGGLRTRGRLADMEIPISGYARVIRVMAQGTPRLPALGRVVAVASHRAFPAGRRESAGSPCRL